MTLTIGKILALIVLVLCIVAGVFSLGAIPLPVLALIGTLALAMILG